MNSSSVECPDITSFCKLNSNDARSLSTLHVNIRSIRKHWDEFLAIVRGRFPPIDVLVLTEINIHEDLVPLFKIQQYSSFSFTRRVGKGGGIMIYVRDNLVVSSINVTFTVAECVALQICLQDAELTLIAVYRPPSENANVFVSELDNILGNVRSTRAICLVGDFNLDIKLPSRPIVNEYLNVLAKWGVLPTITSYTREEHLGSKLVASCLDHINIRAPSVSHISAVVKHKLSDHYFVGCHLFFPEPDLVRLHEQHLTILDIAKFDNLIATFDWTEFLRNVSHLNIYSEFVKTLNTLRSSAQKSIIVTKRNGNVHWLSSDILRSIKERDLLWARCKRCPNNNSLKMNTKHYETGSPLYSALQNVLTITNFSKITSIAPNARGLPLMKYSVGIPESLQRQ